MSDNVLNGHHISDEALSERLDNRLDHVTLRQVETHLGTCADCATRAAGLQATKVALRSLADYGPFPDFQLDPHGPIALPPRASRTQVQEQSFAAWLAVRVVSTVVTFFGVILIAIAVVNFPIYSSANSTNSAATQPISHVTNPTCSVNGCNVVGSPGESHPGSPGPTFAPVATTVPAQSPPPVAAAPAPNPLIALGIGSLLAVGGMIGMARARTRRR